VGRTERRGDTLPPVTLSIINFRICVKKQLSDLLSVLYKNVSSKVRATVISDKIIHAKYLGNYTNPSTHKSQEPHLLKPTKNVLRGRHGHHTVTFYFIKEILQETFLNGLSSYTFSVTILTK
jgi:hypothetical protein